MIDDVKFVEKSYCRSIFLLQGASLSSHKNVKALFYGFELKEMHWNNFFYLFDFSPSSCSGKNMISLADLLIHARMGP